MGVTHPSPKVPPPIPKAASPVTCLRGLYTHIGHSYQREMRAGRVATWRLRCNQCLTNADPTLTVRLMTSSQYDMFFLKFCLYMHFRDVSDRLSAQLILDRSLCGSIPKRARGLPSQAVRICLGTGREMQVWQGGNSIVRGTAKRGNSSLALAIHRRTTLCLRTFS